MDYFTIRQRNLWGDYGNILISGVCQRNSDDGTLNLIRTGPFLPPISFPWMLSGGRAIVVSDEGRRLLQKEASSDVKFRVANKFKIVRLNWHEWDLNDDAPQEYPEEGEPFNYLNSNLHDRRSATQMQDAWEVLLPLKDVGLERLEDPSKGWLNEFAAKIKFHKKIFTDNHKFNPIIVNECFKLFMERSFGMWISIFEVHNNS